MPLIEVMGVSDRIDKVCIPQLWMLPHTSILRSCWSLSEGLVAVAQEGYPHVLRHAKSNTEDPIHEDW